MASSTETDFFHAWGDDLHAHPTEPKAQDSASSVEGALNGLSVSSIINDDARHLVEDLQEDLDRLQHRVVVIERQLHGCQSHHHCASLATVYAELRQLVQFIPSAQEVVTVAACPAPSPSPPPPNDELRTRVDRLASELTELSHTTTTYHNAFDQRLQRMEHIMEEAARNTRQCSEELRLCRERQQRTEEDLHMYSAALAADRTNFASRACAAVQETTRTAIHEVLNEELRTAQTKWSAKMKKQLETSAAELVVARVEPIVAEVATLREHHQRHHDELHANFLTMSGEVEKLAATVATVQSATLAVEEAFEHVREEVSEETQKQQHSCQALLVEMQQALAAAEAKTEESLSTACDDWAERAWSAVQGHTHSALKAAVEVEAAQRTQEMLALRQHMEVSHNNISTELYEAIKEHQYALEVHQMQVEEQLTTLSERVESGLADAGHQVVQLTTLLDATVAAVEDVRAGTTDAAQQLQERATAARERDVALDAQLDALRGAIHHHDSLAADFGVRVWEAAADLVKDAIVEAMASCSTAAEDAQAQLHVAVEDRVTQAEHRLAVVMQESQERAAKVLEDGWRHSLADHRTQCSAELRFATNTWSRQVESSQTCSMEHLDGLIAELRLHLEEINMHGEVRGRECEEALDELSRTVRQHAEVLAELGRRPELETTFAEVKEWLIEVERRMVTRGELAEALHRHPSSTKETPER